ncbi:MAG: sel1 repeat family protein [Firmicutes bacterium]|uniref:Sel1 repeat family protein n=1 Tax=Candidatus Stercoripulliclostridium pullicola TaxID=2840953 RepID=A0A940ICV6_9FIRM|nr:sel1 repeat family protein [Candidatus Stercoripulliclostridium pullicola]
MKEVRSKERKNKLMRYVPAEDEEYVSPLGVLCGEPSEKDIAYIEAFARLYPEAAYDLYTCYNEGIVIGRDVRKAVYWLRVAAREDYFPAETDLAMRYESGDGVAENMSKAHRLYLAAAENGDVFAMYRAGVDYEYGYGVRKNRALARKWYEAAAAEGYESALDALETLCDED